MPQIYITLGIPRVNTGLEIKTNASVTNHTKSYVFFEAPISGDSLPITLPPTIYVWILSSPLVQPFNYRGTWVDSETWKDDSVYYS